jgi:hypothetical protein
MSRVVYSGCYFLSYGVVFPTVFAANFVPGMGSIRDGLMDGAKAANDCVAELRYKKCAESAASPEACSTSDCSTTGASCEMPATS